MKISDKITEIIRAVSIVILLSVIASVVSCKSAVVTEMTKKIDTVLTGEILSPSHIVTPTEKIIIRDTLSEAKKEIQIAVFGEQIQKKKADRYTKWAWVGMIGAVILGVVLLGGIISGIMKFLRFIHVIP